MTTFTEKVEELLTALTTHILENDIEADELMLKQAETAQALIAAHQAEISRVLERVEKAIEGLEIDLEVTREYMLSKGATESQILNMELEADDRTEILNDVRQAINKIKGELQ